jgi:hypothetical protein
MIAQTGVGEVSTDKRRCGNYQVFAPECQPFGNCKFKLIHYRRGYGALGNFRGPTRLNFRIAERIALIEVPGRVR